MQVGTKAKVIITICLMFWLFPSLGICEPCSDLTEQSTLDEVVRRLDSFCEVPPTIDDRLYEKLKNYLEVKYSDLLFYNVCLYSEKLSKSPGCLSISKSLADSGRAWPKLFYGKFLLRCGNQSEKKAGLQLMIESIPSLPSVLKDGTQTDVALILMHGFFQTVPDKERSLRYRAALPVASPVLTDYCSSPVQAMTEQLFKFE